MPTKSRKVALWSLSRRKEERLKPQKSSIAKVKSEFGEAEVEVWIPISSQSLGILSPKFWTQPLPQIGLFGLSPTPAAPLR